MLFFFATHVVQYLICKLRILYICHQVSNQADGLALLAIILLLADVSSTYSSGWAKRRLIISRMKSEINPANNKPTFRPPT